MPRLTSLGDDVVPPEQDAHEVGASKGKEIRRALRFLFDLDEPGLAVVGALGVVLFFVVSGAVALVQQVFFSGGPPQGLGSGS